MPIPPAIRGRRATPLSQTPHSRHKHEPLEAGATDYGPQRQPPTTSPDSPPNRPETLIDRLIDRFRA
jgi:hypothetical protein